MITTPSDGHRSYSARMAGGVLAGLGGLVWARLTGLLAVPLLVAGLGLPLYGVWAISDLLLTSQSLIDLGGLGAAAKFVAEAESDGDGAAIRRVIRISLLWYAAIGVIFAAGVLVILPFMPGWLGVSAADVGPTRVFLIATAALFSLSNFAYVYGSVLQGMQALAVVHAVTSASRAPYLGLVALSWWRGWGVGGVVAATAVMYAIQLVGMRRAALRRIPPSARSVRPPVSLRAYLDYGAKTYVAGVAEFGVLQLPRVAGAVLLGASGAARADLAFRVPTVALAMAAPLLTPMLPAAARLAARGRNADLGRLAARVTRYLLLVCAPVGLVTVVAGPALLVAWVGHAGDGLDAPVRAATVAVGVQTVVAGCGLVIAGMGAPGDLARYRVVLLALSAALVIGVGRPLGLTGVAIGVASASVLAGLYLVAQPLGRLPEARRRVVSAAWRPLLALLPAAAASALALAAGGGVASAAGAGVVVDGAAVILLGAVHREDLRIVLLPLRGRRSPAGALS